MSGGGSEGSVWRVSLRCTAVAVFEPAFEPTVEGGALSIVEDGAGWRLEAIVADAASARERAARVAVLAAAAGVASPRVEIAEIPAGGWVAKVREAVRPVRAGRFYVHPTDDAGAVPRGTLPIALDAGLAFGSGAHETTRLCLLAIDRMPISPAPAACLDLGAGSGILAIAIAKRWPGSLVVASDNDPIATATARANAALNGVAVRCATGPGFRNPALRRRFDLVVANILARPLIVMAPSVARHLAPGATLILSGLLRDQEDAVLAPYRAAGLVADAPLRLGQWSALRLRAG